MRGRREERIEAAIDQTAAAVFAVAAAFAVIVGLRGAMPVARLGVGAMLCGTLAYEACAWLLRRVHAGGEAFEPSSFDVQALEFEEELLLTEQVELLLTDEDRVRPNFASEADELILDDILAQLGPESRVVRLFDRAAMPTAGQLNDRIERHLRGAPPQQAQRPQPADASEALHEALAELRRSLG